MGFVPGQAELLSESSHTRVVRLHLAGGGSVVRKEPLGPDAQARVSHEATILRRLSGVTHVVQLAADQPDANAIQLDDVDGVPLAQVATPLDPPRMAGLMLELARAVGAVHQHGVVHGAVNPGNIMLAGDGAVPYLIDFAMATTFSQLRPDFTHPQEIVGTLAYLAPEQTGRTGRSVDRRADLYGLGATMYELATGHPPFGTGDPLRLIHDHLARAPAPPEMVNPAVPTGLSRIIMHLLEKEPDNRYQTADGVIHDLEQVRDGAELVRAGQVDVQLRLTEPSHLVGRDHEIDVLRAAFEGTLAGECRGVVIIGESGVGKTALLDELRPIVSRVDGWFTSGKYDRGHQDQEHDGVVQALRGLGRLLLAEPEDRLVAVRQRLREALGPNGGLAARLLPEFATLLGIVPEPGDPLTAQDRSRRTALDILRSVVSPERPLAFVVDDLQWGGAVSLGLLDQLLVAEEKVGGLLVVGACREGELPSTHPLAAMVARWVGHPDRPEQLRLRGLDERDLATMVGKVLHAPREAAADLTSSIFGLTRGNPYDTVELLNGLRHEGILFPTESGWRWDPQVLARRLARENVTDLDQARVDGMPATTRDTLEAMACLGGEVYSEVVGIATGLSEVTIQQRLAPALRDGLPIVVARGRAARFRHDRLRDAVLNDIPPDRLRSLRLSMARRLASRPELFAVAAQQYLPVVDALHDPQERRRAAALLRQAADQHMIMGESLPAEQMLAAALRLTDDPTMLTALNVARHTALFHLGRLVEADEAYEAIIQLTSRPFDRVEATRVQISSLTARNRSDDAIGLGLGLLRQLGWALSTSEQVSIEIDRELDWCLRWIEETSEADDLRRPDVTDPTALAVGSLISSMMVACFLRDQVMAARLALAAARIWAEKGPTPTLIGAIGNLPWIFISRRQAYRTGYRLLRRLLAVGEQRAFEPGTSLTHFLYALGMSHWFEPIEETESHARRAREGLIRGGDLQTAAFTFCPGVFEIDLSTRLDDYTAGVDAAAAFADRTGSQIIAGICGTYRWLIAALRGEPADGDALVERSAAEPVGAANAHIVRALAAAVLDDAHALAHHSAAAMSLRPAVDTMYPDWQARLLRAVALAERARTTREPAVDLAELDEIVDWIAQRAADMPANFRHMLSLIEADRAWAVGDRWAALRAFDSALRQADRRPWHRAYATERTAKFMLAHGMDHFGSALLSQAREAYRTWGARAKVEQLDRAYPSLDLTTAAGGLAGASSITVGSIDMLAILEASRALSSETSIATLRSKVVEVLSAMTGASDVGLLVWSTEQRRWLAAPGDDDGPAPVERHQAPESIIRYVERIREPLIVDDATRDDRFARDPYFRELKTCSVLAVPVLSRGVLRAILLLENRLIRDAFRAERLEGVVLIAGQLAVSLDNALVYSSLERKVIERTQQLALANERLAQLSITDPLTGLANRRRLEESLGSEWQRTQRTRAPLSLAMVDIDHFKRYNDKHGHVEGDRCLQRVAAGINRAVRSTDLVARYGGEEFAIVMPDTAPDAAREAAERVRLAVSALAEPLTDANVVTVSIGVATLHDADRESTDRLLEQADAALYQAKRAGRNRARCAESGPAHSQRT